MARPLELSASVALGQFIPGHSLLHRMDPRAKLTVFTLWVVLSVVAWTIAQQAVLFIIFLFLLALGRLPFRFAFSTLRPALPALIVVVLLQLLFLGDSTGLASPVLLHVGFISIRLATVQLVIVSLLRVLSLMVLISTLTLTTSASDLTRGLEGVLRPLRPLRVPVSEIALVCTIALRFTPVFAQEAEQLMKAQAARGADFGEARPWQIIRRTKSVLPVIVPLFLLALGRAENLALAMEARGYVPGARRTSFKTLAWGMRDTGACIVGLLLFFAVLLIRDAQPASAAIAFLF
ncbi:MAG: energy-coupling factor transporter transmembrane component T [Firmicutes bacterium]|nr:energy-coupling factor transporter transmembrane component T [Bacillota bacterium]